ncbi:hypothetical protein MNBD_PLANCTO03-952 [hydrothermal vent metagenome]|uniref:EF-hand domain-containing protein n=1 Tax=hydrothermal vent metagenome TaxID=652676 RepID=A0A3B1E8A5_9ZZZZ
MRAVCRVLAGVVAVVSAPVLAQNDHAHVTVDTENGQVKIVVGYLYGEEEMHIDQDGWMRNGAEVFTITCDQSWWGAPYNGWPIASEQMTLTSEYFGSTGRLDGGYFWYELASVVPVDGGPEARVLWAQEQNGDTLGLIADSEGATREERSFELGFLGHVHDQRQLLDGEGVYEVTLIAWDSNGVYSDSDPVRLYIEVPGCEADFNGDDAVNTQDVIAFLGAWAAGDMSADINGDGIVNTRDVIAFLGLWAAGC